MEARQRLEGPLQVMPEGAAAVLLGPVDHRRFEGGGDRARGDVAFERAAEGSLLAERRGEGPHQELVVEGGSRGDRGLGEDEAGAAEDALLVAGVDAVDTGDEGAEDGGHGG